MARRKKNELSAGAIGGVLVLGMVVTAFQNNPVLAFLAVGALIGLGVWFFMPRSCDLCGPQLKRSVYHWTIEGEKKKLCPNCNSGLERKKSRAAVQRL